MPINVDEAFIRRVAAENTVLGGEAPGAANGPIDNMIIKPGHQNFVVGQNLSTQLKAQGGVVKQRLNQLGVLFTTRRQQLRAFVDTTDDIESLNEMTVGEFRGRIPNF
ncbi:hypothetical protein ACI2K4_02685 [Micromonospora sp. NPDC050397]|uniref:hypothetical protein n=1 Tax=Micromonospora sp. NPDC050397 TaxID=3364279 RepID=UPI00384B4526